MDIATLGVSVDARPVESAIQSLDKLTASAGRAEKSTGELGDTAPPAFKKVTDGADGAAGAMTRVVDGANGAATAIKKVTTSGTEAAPALTAVHTGTANLGAALRVVAPEADKAAASIKKVTTGTEDFSAASGSSSAAIQKTVADIGKLGAATDRSADSIAKTSGAIDAVAGAARMVGIAVAGGFGVAKVIEFSTAIYSAAAAAERLRTTLDFASGGRGPQELAYITAQADKLGLQLTTTAQAYASLQAASRGTALEGEGARKVFEAVSKASSVMGLSAEQSSGALLALQQMVSKGTVQAEELRGQLAERLPGAFQIAARSMGVTTAELGKMLEAGQVIANDFLPKFAEQLERELGGAADKAADRLDAAVNRFDTAWDRLKRNVGESGLANMMKNELSTAATVIHGISGAMEIARESGAGMFGQFAAGVGHIAQFNAQSGTMAKQIEEAEKELATMNATAEKWGHLSIYDASKKAQIERMLIDLRAVKEAQDKVAKVTAANPTQEGMAIQGRGREAYMERQAQARADAEKLLLKSSGVPDGYVGEMQKVIALYERGAMSAAEFTKYINEQQAALLKKTGVTKKATSEEELHSAALKAAMARRASWLAQQDEVNTALELEAIELDLRNKAFAAGEVALKKVLATETQRTATLTADVTAQKLSNAQIGLTRRELAELEATRLEDAAATKEQTAAIQEQMGDMSGLSAEYRKQADQLRALAAEKRSGANRQEQTDTAKAAEEAWNKSTQEIERSLTDALMRGFESGVGFAEVLRDTVVNMFKTMVLRPIISAVLGPVAGAVTGAMGLSSTANAASGAMSLGSAAGGMGSLGSLLSSPSMGALDIGGIGVAGALPWLAGGAAIANALGMFRKTKKVGAGLTGTLGEGDIQGYDLMRKSGTLFSGPDYSARSTGTYAGSAGLQSAYSTLRTSVVGMADMLGVSSDAVRNFTVAIGTESVGGGLSETGLSLSGLSAEEAEKKIADALLGASNKLAAQVLGENSPFIREGEDAITTLGALSGSLGAANSAFKVLGLSLFDASLKGADTARTMIDAFGSLERFNELTTSYYQNFYSDTEKFTNSQRQLRDQFAALGVAVPESSEGFRQLVESVRASGDPQLLADLMALGPAFAQVAKAVEGVFNSIDKSTNKSIRDLEMSVLGDKDKYAYLDKEIEGTITKLGEATSPEEVQALYDQATGDIAAAWGLLSAGEQKKLLEDFKERYKEVDAIAKSRLSVVGKEEDAAKKQEDILKEQIKAQEEARATADAMREANQINLDAATELRLAIEATTRATTGSGQVWYSR